MQKIIAFFLLLPGGVLAAWALAGNWKADAAHAKVRFSVKGPLGDVHGNFSGLKAEIRFNEKDLSGSSVSASIDAASVSTGVGLRNHHLRSKEEWLDVKKYPRIRFQSKKIEKTAEGYKAVGELTLKGVTKPEEIPFTFSSKGAGGVFKGKLSIKREDYHIGKPGGSTGSVITIELEVPVKK